MSYRRLIVCDSCQAREDLDEYADDPKGWQSQGPHHIAIHICPECVKTADRYDEWLKSRKGRKVKR